MGKKGPPNVASEGASVLERFGVCGNREKGDVSRGEGGVERALGTGRGTGVGVGTRVTVTDDDSVWGTLWDGRPPSRPAGGPPRSEKVRGRIGPSTETLREGADD